MRLALAQVGSGTDLDRNLALVRQAAVEAARGGCDLVMLPEYTMYEKKKVDASFIGVAQPLDGPFVTAVASIAMDCGIAVVVGVVEANPDGGNPFNTVVVVDAQGRIAGRYRKRQLYDSHGFHESSFISRPQPEAVVIEVAGARLGLLICADLRHPSLAADLADAGADLIAVCSSWVPGPTKIEQWRMLVAARAIENTCFVAAVSQCAPVSVGSSLVVDPQGTVIDHLGQAPGLLCVEVDLGEVPRLRAEAAESSLA